MIDRIFTNLDFGFLNLPKRVILRSKSSGIGFPVYVLPGDSTNTKIAQAKLDFDFSQVTEENPYGQPSEVIKTTAEPLIIENNHPDKSEAQKLKQVGATPDQQANPSSSQSRNSPDDRTLSFDSNTREKIFIGIVAVIVIAYVAFKFLL